MKFRHTNKGPEKVEQQMAPMIDIVFQLLIFFMLTLRISAEEGDFNVNMPLNAPSVTNQAIEPDLPPMKVRLESNADGKLVRMMLGELSLGTQGGSFSADLAFRQLNERVKDRVADLAKLYTDPVALREQLGKLEVEIDADHELNYEYTIRAMSAVRGKKMPDGNVVTYIEKVKFAPPRQPKLSG